MAFIHLILKIKNIGKWIAEKQCLYLKSTKNYPVFTRGNTQNNQVGLRGLL